MTITVYALINKNKNYIYVGMTNNLSRRFKEHNSGKQKSTKNFRPFKCFYTIEFDSYKKARLAEKYLKSGCGKEFLYSIIE